MRATLYVAANAMLMRSIRWTTLKAWGVRLMKTKGRRDLGLVYFALADT